VAALVAYELARKSKMQHGIRKLQIVTTVLSDKRLRRNMHTAWCQFFSRVISELRTEFSCCCSGGCLGIHIVLGS